MKKTKIYKSQFLNRNNLEEIEPFFIIHRAENQREARYDAKWYFYTYWNDKNEPIKRDKLRKLLLIKSRVTKARK